MAVAVAYGDLLSTHGINNCPESPELQKMWGCAEATLHPQYGVSCDCGGSKNCTFCKGTEYHDYDRCPLHVLTNSPFSNLMLSMYIHTSKGLPLIASGAIIDQPNLWLQSKNVIQAEVNEHEQDQLNKMKSRANKK